MLHSCGYMPVIYPLLDLEGALKQKSREGPQNTRWDFWFTQIISLHSKHIKAVMEESDNDE